MPAPSVIAIEVAVPPAMFQARLAGDPGAIVLGDAVKVIVNGTVTVTLCGADVPPGPVAVSV